jgi:hypothetical protein
MQKKAVIIIALLGSVYLYLSGISIDDVSQPAVADNTSTTLQNAYNRQLSDIQLEGEGVVIKVLPDDLDGSRHQRFILKLAHGQTVLIAHNIDLADKIQSLKKGDRVEFNGEYEWNARGGVIHWTHHDPADRHVHGWLKHRGITYQ